MRRKWILPVAAAVAGLFAGIFRAADDSKTLDLDTGLRSGWSGYAWAAFVVVLLACLFFLLPAFLSRAKEARDPFSQRGAYPVFYAVSAAALVLLVSYDIRRFVLEERFVLLVQAGLSLFFAVSLVLLSRKGERESVGGGSVMAVVPVFWACFWLIVTYGDHAADPVITDYMYELLGEASIIVALYLIACLTFGKGNFARASAFLLLSLFFSVFNLVEPLACLLFFGSSEIAGPQILTRLYFLPFLILMPTLFLGLQTPLKHAEKLR